MTISPKTVLIFLGSFAGAFFVLFMVLVLNQESLDILSREPLALFNVDAEVSIPTWYAQSLLLAASGLLFLIAKSARKDKKYWYALAAIMLFVSIDEGASIHELLVTPMRELLSISEGPLYYAWVVVYGVLLGCIGLFFVRFFARLPRKTRVLFAASLLTFVAGAIGMEMIGASVVSQSDMVWQLYALVVGVEELLEMLGVTLFIYTLLDYVANHENLPKIYIGRRLNENPQ